MIIRKRKKPRVLEKYDAIILRLRPNFYGLEKIKQEQSRRYKGYIGEQKVDYHTDFLADDSTILYDVCIDIHGKTMQTDTIIITQYAIFIVESKNYNGTITFDTILEQLTRDDGKKETGFQYPITQVQLQQFKLQLWLRKHNLPNIPIYFFIAISEPSTIIKVVGDREAIAKVVAHGASIPMKLLDKNEKIADGEAAEIKHRKIGEMLLRECKEYDQDVMAKHGVRENDLLPGVQCPKCGLLGMARSPRNWHCLKCSYVSINAHLRTLNDYFLLISPWLSNQKCMHFLNISSRHVISRMLKKCKMLKYHSNKRNWTLK